MAVSQLDPDGVWRPDLRNAIINALLDPPNDPGRGLADYSPDRASESTLANAVLAVLADPALLRQVLDATQTDTRETLSCPSCGITQDDWPIIGGFDGRSVMCPVCEEIVHVEPVFVVRSRGEQPT